MQILNETTLNIQSPNISWSSQMDLISVWSRHSPLLQVFRCGDKLQKIFQRENLSGSTFTSFSFIKSGKYCAVGLSDGQV